MTFETCLGENNTLFVRKRRDIHSHHVCSENFASRRVSVDVLCNLMYKVFLSFKTLLLVCLKMFEQFVLN